MTSKPSLVAVTVTLGVALATGECAAQDSRWLSFFSVRPMFGGALVVPDTPPLQGEFAADFTVGLKVFRQRRDGRAWLLGPELGFTPLNRNDDITVLWHFGLQVGYGTVPLHVAWVPRFVVGAAGLRDVLGVRNGLVLTTLGGLGCVELSHQYLWSDGEGEHGLRVTVGVDLGMLVHILMRSMSDLSRW